MDIFQAALLCGAIVALALNYREPRAWCWILLGAADFIFTDLYQTHSWWWLPHPFVTGITDATVAVCLSLFGVNRWERFVRYAFMLSVLVSISRLAGWIETRYAYVVGLELCNWLALFVISGTGITRLVDEGVGSSMVGQDTRAGLGRALHRARTFLDSPGRPKGILARTFVRQ